MEGSKPIDEAGGKAGKIYLDSCSSSTMHNFCEIYDSQLMHLGVWME